MYHFFKAVRYTTQALLLRFAVRPIYKTLAFFLSVDPRKACFISFPDIADNALELSIQFVQQEPDWSLVWLVRNEKLSESRWQQLGIASQRVTICKAYSWRGVYHALTARLLYHTHGLTSYMSERPAQFVVNLWHGMPLKTIGTYDQGGTRTVSRIPAGDVTLATSGLFQEVMAKAFNLSQQNVWLTGQPRTDRLVRFAESAAPDHILWMPTYRVSIYGEIRSDSSKDAVAKMIEDFQALDKQLAPDGHKILVKFHPMDYLNSVNLPKLGNVHFLLSTDSKASDLERLMANAKALITDFSSAAVDFAILRRPIGFYVPDKTSYTRGLIDVVVEEVGFFGPLLTDVKAIAKFATEVEKHESQTENLDKLHKYFDCGASRRVIAASLNAINNEPS